MMFLPTRWLHLSLANDVSEPMANMQSGMYHGYSELNYFSAQTANRMGGYVMTDILKDAFSFSASKQDRMDVKRLTGGFRK